MFPFYIPSSKMHISEDPSRNAYSAVVESSKVELSEVQLKKLHIHLGHAPYSCMVDTLRASGRNFDSAVLKRLIDERPCFNSRSQVGSSAATVHKAPFPGYAVFFDIVYLKERIRRDFPFFFVLGGFSRFIVCPPAKSIRPVRLVEIFMRQWVFFFGFPLFLIRDGGPGTFSAEWNSFDNTHCVCLATSPPECSSQMGALERHVGLVKLGISRISSVSPELGFGRVVTDACIFRNHSILLGNGFTPVKLVYGRGDFFSSLEFGGLHTGRNSPDAEIVRQRHMLGMLQARSDMIQAGAERTISLCLNRNVRAGARIPPKIGEQVLSSIKGR